MSRSILFGICCSSVIRNVNLVMPVPLGQAPTIFAAGEPSAPSIASRKLSAYRVASRPNLLG